MPRPQIQCQPPQNWRPDGVLAAGSSAAFFDVMLGPCTHYYRPQISYSGLHKTIVSMLMDNILSSVVPPPHQAIMRIPTLDACNHPRVKCAKMLLQIARGCGGHCSMLRHALPRMLALMIRSVLNATACQNFQPFPHRFLPVVASVSPSSACQAVRVPAVRQAPGQL